MTLNQRTWPVWVWAVGAALVAILAVGEWVESLTEARDAARYPAPGVLIDVGGRRLHLLCKGPHQGPIVVMIAGGGTPAVVSYPLQDRIAKFARVCSFDRAGVGWSEAATRALTFDDQVDDLENLLRNGHVVGPYLFVPESFGSLLAIRFAERHPAQVAGVVFLDGVDPQLWFKGMANESGMAARFENALMDAAWRTGAVRTLFPLLAPSWTGKLPDPIKGELVAIYSRPSLGYGEALKAFDASPVAMRPHLVPGALGERPVFVLYHGQPGGLSVEFEAGWKTSARRLAEWSGNSVMVTVGDADHQIAQEQPDLAAHWVQKAYGGLKR